MRREENKAQPASLKRTLPLSRRCQRTASIVIKHAKVKSGISGAAFAEPCRLGIFSLIVSVCLHAESHLFFLISNRILNIPHEAKLPAAVVNQAVISIGRQQHSTSREYTALEVNATILQSGKTSCERQEMSSSSRLTPTVLHGPTLLFQSSCHKRFCFVRPQTQDWRYLFSRTCCVEQKRGVTPPTWIRSWVNSRMRARVVKIWPGPCLS